MLRLQILGDKIIKFYSVHNVINVILPSYLFRNTIIYVSEEHLKLSYYCITIQN